MSESWHYRPSKKYANTGIYWRISQLTCPRHGLSEHVEVKEYSKFADKKNKELPMSLCRLCCDDVEVRRQEENQRSASKSHHGKINKSKW